MVSVGTGVVTQLWRGDSRELAARCNDERRMCKPDDPVQRPSLAGGADRLVMRVMRRRPTGVDVRSVPDPRARFAERGNADGQLRHQRQQSGSSQKDRSERGGSWRAHRE